LKFEGYQRLVVKLLNYVKERGVSENIDFDIEDVYFVCREMADWKSVVTGLGGASMELFVWDEKKMVNGKNLIVLGAKEFKVFKKRRVDGTDQEWFDRNPEVERKIMRFLGKCGDCYGKASMFPIFTNLEKNATTKN
jgi:hypothetical protein